ncbi:MAG: DUF1847 domain-containing protein [Candidatus Bathyarchaeia archaeon]
MGLCIGHDILFTMTSKAPVTTLDSKGSNAWPRPCYGTAQQLP